ncbi:hypothetical protein C8J56DRAFT_889321 [Mycena floridula]|nr:hypothetical protein C8J56DRAFT_889321 [Mycena floridula]
MDNGVFRHILLCPKCHHKIPRIQQTIPDPAHLHSTFVPSDFDISESRTFLADANDDIQRYDDEITCLTATLESDKSQRALPEEDRKLYRALRSSIRRIPFEIWAEIFAFTMTGEPNDLRLPQVCICWRDILLEASFLWHSVKLELDESRSESLLSLIKSCKLYYQLSSRDISLQVKMRFPAVQDQALYSSQSRIPNLQRLFTAILDELGPTISKLQLNLFHSVWAPVIISLKASLMVNLTSLGIIQNTDSGVDHTAVLNVLSVFPNLSHLIFSKIHIPPEKGNRFLSPMSHLWDQLQTVELRNCSSWVASQFLTQARNLTAMKIHETKFEWNPWAQAPTKALSTRLTHLALDEWSDISLEQVTISSLTSIHILGTYMCLSRPYIQHFASFIGRSACLLQSLWVEDLILDDNQLLEILLETPQLRSFSFTPIRRITVLNSRTVCISGQLYRQMTFGAGADDPVPLVPHLQSLKIASYPGEVAEALLDMVTSRLSHHSDNHCLHHCEVRLVSEVLGDDIPLDAVSSFCERVVEMKRNGLYLFGEVVIDKLDGHEAAFNKPISSIVCISISHWLAWIDQQEVHRNLELN